MRYIGSKNTLLKDIEDLIEEKTNGTEQVFLDLFAGTNVVGDYFKDKYTVYTNDLLYFSYVNARATIENNEPLVFEKLKNLGIDSPLDFLQNNADNFAKSSNIVGYYEENYTPTGDSMYFTKENGKRIDYIRDKIEEWKKENLLNENEYFYLISTLVEAIPYVSNTTGTYGAFLKHWDKRALNPLLLNPLEIKNNNRKNKSYNEDSNTLIKNIEADIVYIDTPYNNRQYASNYHVLENIARHNKPTLRGKTKIFEWKHLRSDYAMKNRALAAMSDLIKNINANHIILSYNTEGIIPEDELIALLKENSYNNEVTIKRIPYRKYKSKKPSDNYDLHELLIHIQKKESKKTKKGNSLVSSDLIKSSWKIEKTKLIKSPLNYIGGKYKLLNQILPLFPTKINTFVDLFSGGGNVGINVNATKYIFNDMNYKINEMFRFFQSSNVEELIQLIKEKIDYVGLSKTNEEAFLKFREEYNNNPNPLDLYILISYSYNYQIRFNNSGKYNNPFGRNRSQFSENMERNLYNFTKKIQEVDAIFTDFLFDEMDLEHLKSDDFVYLDPPYLITTGSYNDGNRGFVNWSKKQEDKMYNLMKNLNEKGVKYALSNVIEHKGKEHELLKSFIEENDVNVHYLNYNYNNSSYNTKGTGSVEVLITNY